MIFSILTDVVDGVIGISEKFWQLLQSISSYEAGRENSKTASVVRVNGVLKEIVYDVSADVRLDAGRMVNAVNDAKVSIVTMIPLLIDSIVFSEDSNSIAKDSDGSVLTGLMTDIKETALLAKSPELKAPTKSTMI